MIQMISGACNTPSGLKRSSDGPFELPPEQEERLVRRGVARYLVATDGEHTPEPEPAPEPAELAAPALDRDELMAMTRAQLEDMAKSMGIDTRKCKNKGEVADLIEIFGDAI